MLGPPPGRRIRRSRPIDIEALINDNLAIVVGVLGVVTLLSFVLAFIAWRRAAGLERRLQGLTRGSDGRNLEAVLDAHLDKVFAVARSCASRPTRSVVGCRWGPCPNHHRHV